MCHLKLMECIVLFFCESWNWHWLSLIIELIVKSKVHMKTLELLFRLFRDSPLWWHTERQHPQAWQNSHELGTRERNTSDGSYAYRLSALHCFDFIMFVLFPTFHFKIWMPEHIAALTKSFPSYGSIKYLSISIAVFICNVTCFRL